jgi:hypothetical protein
MRSAWGLVWSVMAVLIAGALAVVAALAAGAIPRSWDWAHDSAVLWSVVLGLIIVGAIITAVQYRMPSQNHDQRMSKQSSTVHVGHAQSSAVVATNSGTMIHGRTVIVGSPGTVPLNGPSSGPETGRASSRTMHGTPAAVESGLTVFGEVPQRPAAFQERTELQADLEGTSATRGHVYDGHLQSH